MDDYTIPVSFMFMVFVAGAYYLRRGMVKKKHRLLLLLAIDGGVIALYLAAARFDVDPAKFAFFVIMMLVATAGILLFERYGPTTLR